MKMMKLILIVAMFTLHPPLDEIKAAEPTPRDVVDKMDEAIRGNTFQARMVIKIKRPRMNRTLELESWDDSRQKKSFTRILRPTKDRGVAFLKDHSNLWQYIPSIGKEIKIEGSLLQDSWMGTDFSNDDMVRTTSVVDDYKHRFLQAPSDNLYRIEMIPNPTAPITWSKVIVDVKKEGYLPVKQEFYDHKGRLKRVMNYSEYRVMGGRNIPTVYDMDSIEDGKVVSTTSMIFKAIAFNAPISAFVFSKANMRR